MNCPVDGTELRITDRHGIEIDYCPTCRGVSPAASVDLERAAGFRVSDPAHLGRTKETRTRSMEETILPLILNYGVPLVALMLFAGEIGIPTGVP